MLREVRRQVSSAYAGIGVACPGPLDPFTGIIGDVGTLPGWQGGNIVAELGREFGVPIVVENDADAAALAEATWGRAVAGSAVTVAGSVLTKDSGCFLYVTISTGIGAGMVLAGELYRGAGGAHPEMGHQVLDWSGPLCYCGSRGCWEGLASGPAMTAWMREQRPAAGELTAEHICGLARRGDELALRAVERESRYIGLGLANLITIFAPEVIVLGGGVMNSADLFLDRVRQVVRETATQVPFAKTRIVSASLGPDTALAGAAMGWIHRCRQT
jgi:glucokinase